MIAPRAYLDAVSAGLVVVVIPLPGGGILVWAAPPNPTFPATHDLDPDVRVTFAGQLIAVLRAEAR